MPLCSRNVAVVTSIACISIIAIVGITALVLGLKGYLTFHDPCIGVESFSITDMDLESAKDNNILGFIDTFTGGLASNLVPTQAVVTIEMVLEVNNTNPYDLEYEQSGEGVIEIPADQDGNDVDEDLVVGTWELPSSTLKANARNEIPVEVTATIDLLSSEAAGLAGSFITGDLVVFRVRGGIEGSSWVPGATGGMTFVCIANVDNILDLDTGARIKCSHRTKVLNIIDKKGDVDVTDFFEEDEVDPLCLV